MTHLLEISTSKMSHHHKIIDSFESIVVLEYTFSYCNIPYYNYKVMIPLVTYGIFWVYHMLYMLDKQIRILQHILHI